MAVFEGATNPVMLFVHTDHLNRPVMMSNGSKAFVWRAEYEPFGAVHAVTGPAANDNRFPGQLFQLESGLAYNWHRHYDATLGRYTQGDPSGLQTLLSDGPSVYGYAVQSPLMLVDPRGLDSTSWWNTSQGRNPVTHGPTMVDMADLVGLAASILVPLNPRSRFLFLPTVVTSATWAMMAVGEGAAQINLARKNAIKNY